MNPWQVIKQLEATNSRKDKEHILLTEVLRDNNSVFWDGVRLALDPMITFGVKAVPIKEDADGTGLDYEAFGLALTGFVNRQITGNAGQNTIKVMMSSATKEQWNDWYRRILIKDLRCGVTETTINKIRPNTVPVFACQLAKDASDHENKMKGRKILDYKLDGVRVLAVIQRIDIGAITTTMPKVTLFSRNGKVFENFPHIQEQLAISSIDIEGDWVLDGEITSSTFQDLMTQVHRKKDANANDAVFNVFDFIPLDSFLKGSWDWKQERRSRDLKGFMGNFIHDGSHVKILDHWVADLDTDEGQDMLDKMRDKAAKLGLEGVMVKDADAPYECKRTASWLKIKPNITIDLTVVNIEPGTGRNEGRLGALVCEGVDDGRNIMVNVGSGFTDTARDTYWASKADILGQIVEVKADAVTQNQDGTYSLRFPRFIRFRGFEPGEKI